MSEENTSNQDGVTGAELIAALVGPEKKFKTVEDLAKGKIEADTYIDTLKNQLAEANKGAEEKQTIKDLIEAYKSSQKDTSEENTTPLTDDVLKDKFGDFIKEREADRTREANRSTAKELVSQKVNGDSEAIDAYVAEKAKTLGMSAERLWSVSEESSSAFAALVGLGQPTPNTGSPSGLPNQNSQFESSGPSLEIEGHKTKAWYDAQRREMGNKKFIGSSKIQLGMLEDRAALGDRFYS